MQTEPLQASYENEVWGDAQRPRQHEGRGHSALLVSVPVFRVSAPGRWVVSYPVLVSKLRTPAEDLLERTALGNL